MRPAVGGDHASVMVDLMKQRDVPRPLYNLKQVALISCREHGNPLLALEDATLTQRAIRVAIEFMPLVFCGALGVSFSGLRQHRRYGAIRPHDQRGSFGGKPDIFPVKTVEFEIVTETLLARGAQLDSLAHIISSLPGTFGKVGQFLIRIELLRTEILWPFEGRHRVVCPYSLQVWLAAGCPWRSLLCTNRQRNKGKTY